MTVYPADDLAATASSQRFPGFEVTWKCALHQLPDRGAQMLAPGLTVCHDHDIHFLFYSLLSFLHQYNPVSCLQIKPSSFVFPGPHTAELSCSEHLQQTAESVLPIIVNCRVTATYFLEIRFSFISP